jgi:Interleukin-like EMT inducer
MTVATHVGVYGLFLGLVTVYTWPLVTAPGHLLPPNGDPRLFSWVLLTMFRNLASRPELLFHGNAFYPFGSTLSFAEPLLIPALVAGPLDAWTGNPILAYNVSLALFWALSGWSMYWVAWKVTGSHAAAFVAAVVFTFAPYRMDHYQEFQMEMAFGIPIAIYALVRFVETRRARWVGALVVAFWVQAASVWYYAIILAFGVIAVLVQLGALRWSGWRARNLVAPILGGVVLVAALTPLATPYFVTRQELGLERSLDDAVPRSANLGSFVEARANWLYEAFTARRRWEASLFLGLVGTGLVMASGAWLRRAGPAGWPERWLAGATGALLAALLGTVLLQGEVRIGAVSFRPFTELGVALLAVLLLRQAVEGWRWWRAKSDDSRLSEREWVMVLLGLTALAVLLSLGPVVAFGAFGARPVDEGLYAWLWPHVLLFRAIRGPTRIGILVLFAGALLAALGVKWLLERSRRPVGPVLVSTLGLALLLEYAWMPLPYLREGPPGRAVDVILAADHRDVAVLEWPPHVRSVDLDAMFRSLAHGKRVVNGLSGFVPAALRDLSLLMTVPANPLSPATQEALQRIYPLRYLIVRLANHRVAHEWQPTWHRFRRIHPPMLRYRGNYGDVDLYDILPTPEQGFALERWISYDFLVAHPIMEVSVRSVGREPGRHDWVDLALNGRALARVPLDSPRQIQLHLRPPFRRAAPNIIRLTYGYDLADLPGAREIGTTRVRSPVDLLVVSGGQPHGDVASVRVNTVERARNQRGYNLVALSPAGRVLDVDAFDTFRDPGETARLARWIDALPRGTIVAGAVKDEGSGHLDGAGFRALQSVGVRGDLRGRFRESHGFVGVKGARVGSALEGAGPRRVTLAVGEVRPATFTAGRGMGVELTSFALHPTRGEPSVPPLRDDAGCDATHAAQSASDRTGRSRGC